jgi:hypothetical protein
MLLPQVSLKLLMSRGTRLMLRVTFDTLQGNLESVESVSPLRKLVYSTQVYDQQSFPYLGARILR